MKRSSYKYDGGIRNVKSGQWWSWGPIFIRRDMLQIGQCKPYPAYSIEFRWR